MSVYQQRKRNDSLSPELRRLALDSIKASGGLTFAKSVILQLQSAVWEGLEMLEGQAGSKNWILRLVLKRLEIV